MCTLCVYVYVYILVFFWEATEAVKGAEKHRMKMKPELWRGYCSQQAQSTDHSCGTWSEDILHDESWIQDSIYCFGNITQDPWQIRCELYQEWPCINNHTTSE